MKPILPGGRGPAVEDVQRRLLILGHDLGPTGVDGVFLGRTRDAVTSFQREHQLSEDGIVGAETWSALVDETFTLGDRMLYLRLPHFHGRDVRVLQEALNALGFSCGVPDSIFGPFTERAVREFQRNSGLPADGIVGPDTVRTVEHLRHVWQGKRDQPPASSVVGTARLGAALSSSSVVIRAHGESASEVADRAVNLALATDRSARVFLGGDPDEPAEVILELREGPVEPARGEPVVTVDPASDPQTLHLRLRTALEARSEEGQAVVIELSSARPGEAETQRAAVLLLDAICSSLS